MHSEPNSQCHAQARCQNPEPPGCWRHLREEQCWYVHMIGPCPCRGQLPSGEHSMRTRHRAKHFAHVTLFETHGYPQK